MKRVCFILKVRQEKLEEYKRIHADVWPEMRAALQATGWRNYSLFLREDGTLVGYLETEDFEAAVAGMQKQEVNLRWQTRMAPFFEDIAGKKPDEKMRTLEEVFHLQ